MSGRIARQGDHCRNRSPDTTGAERLRPFDATVPIRGIKRSLPARDADK